MNRGANPKGVEMETVELERMKLVGLQYMTEELAEQFAIPPELDVSLHASPWADEMVWRIVQKVYGRTMQTVEAKYPADWWQAFKERWYPVWAKKLWPVLLTRVRLDAKELYPKLSAPDYGPQLQLYLYEDRPVGKNPITGQYKTL